MTFWLFSVHSSRCAQKRNCCMYSKNKNKECSIPAISGRSLLDQSLADYSTSCRAEECSYTGLSQIIRRLSGTAMASPLRTSILKKYSPILSPILSKLANLSSSTGVFPSTFKSAQVLPILKKTSLDPSSPANYRPISSLFQDSSSYY